MIWKWVASSGVYAVHDKQLAEHGGLSDVRDLNAVELALIWYFIDIGPPQCHHSHDFKLLHDKKWQN